MRTLSWVVVLITAILGLKFWVNAQNAPDWNDCQACHGDLYGGTYKYMHPTVTSCLGCHISHQDGQGKLLLGDPVIICQEPCHTNLGRSHPTGRNLRNPTSGLLQDLTCTNYCHDPHGSNFKGILRIKARDLCFSCHDL